MIGCPSRVVLQSTAPAPPRFKLPCIFLLSLYLFKSCSDPLKSPYVLCIRTTEQRQCCFWTIHRFRSSYTSSNKLPTLNLRFLFLHCPYLAHICSVMLPSRVLSSVGFHSCPYTVCQWMNPQSEVYAAKFLYSNTLNKKINVERRDPVTSNRPSYLEGFGFKPRPEGCPS
jgi:hypothetical protein